LKFEEIIDFADNLHPDDMKLCEWNYGFQIITKDRVYILYTNSKESLEKWVVAFNKILKKSPKKLFEFKSNLTNTVNNQEKAGLMKDKTLKKENNLDNKIPLFGNESRSPDKKELDNDYVVIDNTNNMQKPNIKPNIVKNEWNNKKDDEKQRKLKEEEENQRKILEDIQKQRKLKEDEEMKLKSKEEEEKLRKIKEDDERLIRRREEEEKREKERKNVQKKDLIYDGEIENILNDADRSFDNIGGEKEGINIAAKQTKLNNGRSTSVITQDLKQNPNQAKPNPLKKKILEAENLEKRKKKEEQRGYHEC